MTGKIEILPASPERWSDLEKLFGARGACGGCWCMFWKETRKEFEAKKGDENRLAMKIQVESGAEPGLIAYIGGEPAGWCAVAPRESYPALERSRVYARVDGEKVWSIVCFFIAKKFRRQGLSVALIKAAVDYAKSRGAKIVEGYPKAPKAKDSPDVFAWTGTVGAFEKCGFTETARRSETSRVMRFYLKQRR